MDTVTLTVTGMANGGLALGRDESGRVIFVPQAIPGERVEVEIVEARKRHAHARLRSVQQPSPDRVQPPCPHFGPCGGCHFQHIGYQAQLRYKEEVVRDQLARVGGLENAPVLPVITNPEPWRYGYEACLDPTPEGELGYWSPVLQRVLPIETCHVIHPELIELLENIQLDTADLRSLCLRTGHDGALLLSLESHDDEPPALKADLPVSVALVLSEGRAVSLVGESYVEQLVKGVRFRVTAGCFFYPSPVAAGLLVDVVLGQASPLDGETVLELYAGVGTLTAFLAEGASQVIGVEISSDATADAAVNLDAFDNVSLYEGPVEEIVPMLDVKPSVMVVAPPADGLPVSIVDEIARLRPRRLVYVSQDVATLARDGRRLAAQGLELEQVQPVDMYPQTYHLVMATLWLG